MTHSNRIAFVTYETPFAPCGGIAAVMGRIPGALQKVSGRDTVVITPYHHRIPRTSGLDVEVIGRGRIAAAKGRTDFELLRHRDSGRGWDWYFVRAEDEQIFAGGRHPYDMGGTGKKANERLLADSLFFGGAVAEALNLINPAASWTLLLQDWEAATAALFASGTGKRTAFLTLHNSYDCGVTDGQIARFGLNPAACPGRTVLERALPLVEEPVFTVSEQFAHDLTTDPLQAVVMAPHLQRELTPRLVGVDNGLFINPSVPAELIAQAAWSDCAGLLDWKRKKRAEFVDALARLEASDDKPVWGVREQFQEDGAPWFVMAGRDDSRQKGYDVAAQAAREFLTEGGQARFLFFPNPGEEGLEGLRFLKDLAEGLPGSVLVFPFFFQEGFAAAQNAATFGVMPSLYEPFGAANEFYLNGAVGIGRATGGVVQQIVPWREATSFTEAVRSRADLYHAPSATPTGFLYREPDGLPGLIRDWEAINAAGYRTRGGPNRVRERSHYGLFNEMVLALKGALADAANLYQRDPEAVCRMLAAGFAHITSSFSWERAAKEYFLRISGQPVDKPPARSAQGA